MTIPEIKFIQRPPPVCFLIPIDVIDSHNEVVKLHIMHSDSKGGKECCFFSAALSKLARNFNTYYDYKYKIDIRSYITDQNYSL